MFRKSILLLGYKTNENKLIFLGKHLLIITSISQVEKCAEISGFSAKKWNWIYSNFQPQKWAEISWFSRQKNELNSCDCHAKKTSWIQVMFMPTKLAKISCFPAMKVSWNKLIFSQEMELKLVVFQGNKMS